jgi:hypothetical protein
MITLIQRPGASLHTLSALLDYCTVEGGLEGFPTMIPGNNLHTHIDDHKKIKKEFYDSKYMHPFSDKILFGKIFGKYWTKTNAVLFKKTKGLTLAPIAKNDFGKLLIFTMGVGKCFNKKLPPDDLQIDYSGCTNLSEKIELVSLILSDVLKQNFEKFFGHNFPTYHIDVLWYWENPNNICTIIQQCGWTPIVNKVHDFCQRVTVFNALYYDTVEKSFGAFHSVVTGQNVPCNLTFYETAITHALLINHHRCTHPSQIKLIHQLPTSTGEFFNLYNPAQSQ